MAAILIKQMIKVSLFLKRNVLHAVIFVHFFASCQSTKGFSYDDQIRTENIISSELHYQNQAISDTTFVNLKDYSSDFERNVLRQNSWSDDTNKHDTLYH